MSTVANNISSQTTALNPVQLHLLKMFSMNMSEIELSELKAMLVAYYDEKMSDELDEIWEKRGFSQKTMDGLLENHPKRFTYK